MRYIKLILNTLFLTVAGLTGLQAQNAILTSGSNATGSGGKVSYSVGQVVYSTNMGSNGTVAQGVQQPYEISVITAIEEAKGISLSVSAQPNPFTDYLILTVDNYELSALSYQLYDINGRLIETKKLEGNQTSIVTSNLVPAAYFLKVAECNKEVKTFKIIKN